ncbi:Endochitinase B1 [Penicillium cinerascens]|uniref:chitinase n=1 Tax=Penicillium cinerascens TaxID=70096 RepID=A0A9W9JLW2_9EURO|nr:Endochitinase B1 [Penicillium cinerascens]KAJ5198739.1 Endochitinase B1 [Penicillium cinerascens]
MVTSQGSGYRSVAYFVNWAIYARGFYPENIPINELTHILYAFANVHIETGEVFLSDLWADEEKLFPGDVWSDAGSNVYGCIKQLFLLKQKNRQLKVLLSIGGWTYSSNFAGALGTEIGRAKFVSSAVKLVQDLGLDGIDIDWEYPADDTQAENLVTALQELRSALDTYSAKHADDYHFLISVACPAGQTHYEKLRIPAMEPYIDFWNLMAYDYSGSWDTHAGHDANIYPSLDNAKSTPFNSAQAVEYYISNGVDPSRIMLGMPLYGRSFMNTDGPGTVYNGVGDGNWENGVWDYKDLPFSAAQINFMEEPVASFSFDPVQQKAQFIVTKGLGGAMWWESSSDKAGPDSLIRTVVTSFGGVESLDQSQNQLQFGASRFDNLKNGFPSS